MEGGAETVAGARRRGARAETTDPRTVALRRVAVRHLAGTEYPLWASTVSLVAALGYAISIGNSLVFRGTSDFPNLWSEVLTFAAACAGIVLARRQPTRSAAIVLIAVWLEFQFGFFTASDVMAIGALATPVLVAGAGLLLGSRWSLAFALSSALLTPVFVIVGHHLRGLDATSHPGFERFYVLHAIANLAMWAVTAAGVRAFGRSFQQTKASEYRLAETIRMAPDGILLIAGDHTVEAINPAAERILGVVAAEWVRRPVDELLRSSGADDVARRQLSDGAPTASQMALSLRSHDGVPTYLEVTSRRNDEGGEHWMLRDVTERVHAEATRRDMELQLAHVQRLEAVGQLAGGIAHDFNNLLTAIGASAEMLRTDLTDDEDRVLVDDIIAAHERGRTRTRQRLSFARRELGEARVCDLAAQVRGLERLLARIGGERVRLSFACDGDCRVRADIGQLENALVNLVSNARDAMPDGGACRVAVDRIYTPDGGAWAALSVSDTGVGMDEATRRRAFEPFFTTKPRGKGTGLGLASVHGMVMSAGGRARIDSVPGLGTTVTLEFPAVNLPIEAVRANDEPGERRRAVGEVLVAEDDQAIRATVLRILSRAGYAVTTAADGVEAARIAEARTEPFDLVLTDVIMPSLTGPQLIARLRRRWPQQPALFMSGYPEDALAGVPNFSIQRDFLAKPFRPVDLERRVADAMNAARPLVSRA